MSEGAIATPTPTLGGGYELGVNWGANARLNCDTSSEALAHRARVMPPHTTPRYVENADDLAAAGTAWQRHYRTAWLSGFSDGWAAPLTDDGAAAGHSLQVRD